MTHIYPPLSAAERLYRGQRHAHPHTRSRSNPPLKTNDAGAPWGSMSHTFTVVEEQKFFRRGLRGLPMKTEEWVREQQTIFQPIETDSIYQRPRARTTSKIRRQEWEELIYIYEVEADEWMRHEEQARRVAQEREAARLRIQEELRRIDARYYQKREAERLARDETRRREHSETRDKERRLAKQAWAKYESCWSSLSTTTEVLDFESVPWPLIAAAKSIDDITQDAIVAFLFSSQHSQDQSRKERIRSAQLRWHPDRFCRYFGRVSESDKATVEEGVGTVARVLNELMEKEKKK